METRKNPLRSSLITIGVSNGTAGFTILPFTAENNDRRIRIASNVSDLAMVDMPEMTKLPELNKLLGLKRMQLNFNIVDAFPDMSKLFALTEIELTRMHSLKSLGDNIGRAPALASLDVRRCYNLRLMPRSFTEGVTRVEGHGSVEGAAIMRRRFKVLRVMNCPLWIPSHIKKLVGLVVLHMNKPCGMQTKFPPLKSFVDLRELVVKNTSYDEWPAAEDMAALVSLQLLEVANMLIDVIPECIGLLAGLTELRIDDLDIVHLPRSVGNLLRLETLALKRCDWLLDIPECIAALPALRRFSLGVSAEAMQRNEMFPLTFMFLRVAAILPLMRGLQKLSVTGMTPAEGVVLARSLKAWTPARLEQVRFRPTLRALGAPSAHFAAEEDEMQSTEWKDIDMVRKFQNDMRKIEAFVCGVDTVMGAMSTIPDLNQDVLKRIMDEVCFRPAALRDCADLAERVAFSCSGAVA